MECRDKDVRNWLVDVGGGGSSDKTAGRRNPMIRSINNIPGRDFSSARLL